MVRTCILAMCSTPNTYKTPCCWFHNHTPNFCGTRPVILEIRNRDTHVRTCNCTRSSTSVKRLANGPLTTYQNTRNPSSRFRYGKQGTCGTSARAHMRTCTCTTTMTCAICTTTWSLNTHKIWSQSAESFLSYGLAANFDTLHAACMYYLPG